MKTPLILTALIAGLLMPLTGTATVANAADAWPQLDLNDPQESWRQLLDAPLLFTKRHSYSGIHIYDTYYKWPPGGGGIYVLENPTAPRSEWQIRAVIDPDTPETLGEGVYTDPELSWDATRLLFCFKGEPQGNTSIYEIGVDGRGLRRVTDPTASCDLYKGSLSGQHDVAPAYLPDGRIVFLSTRPSGLVPCFNTGVAILHVMNADGSDMHTISVNNVNEFDPVVLPDGRVLLGRWEYVDKNALTIQSLWTMHPDGTRETAFFANNMVFPEAVLDARPVPGSHLIVGTFAKHNSTPRGSIAFVDPRLGKNALEAVFNLEHPEDPTFDKGDSCEPWPLSKDFVLCSGRTAGAAHNVIQILDRAGNRTEVLAESDICLHSPMLIKPRPLPRVIPDVTNPQAKTGRFFVQDIYRGLSGVKRGEVKWLRVLEETSRISERSGGANPYNQTFLVSSALAFSVKNYLGRVPVDEDGSAFFEIPSGRAIYLQALDAEGRLVQSMRTFVQAAPGVTRSCIGCHEDKFSTSEPAGSLANAFGRTPDKLQPESWGSGQLDYPSMVQPILDRRCVRCHGGEEGIAGGMDLSGGWTEHFNISYENLTTRSESQLVAYWISGIDCMNGTALWSARLFPPRSHGSGSAPLAELLVSGHEGQISDLTRTERDLLMAWIDSNGVYHGSWNTTAAGCAIVSWPQTRNALSAEMGKAGCFQCHGKGDRITYFESDWINLKRPEMSRILRAPLAAGSEGHGLGLCRDRQVDPARQRIRLLVNGYAHAVQPPEAFPQRTRPIMDASGQPVVSFDSPENPHYQRMLAILRNGREQAMAAPRADMPDAEIFVGQCRQFLPLAAPDVAPVLTAATDAEGVVQLSWQAGPNMLGLEAELHRSGQPAFAPSDSTLLARTQLARFTDATAVEGQQHYALLVRSPDGYSVPSFTTISIPRAAIPQSPVDLETLPASGAVRLRWQAATATLKGYHVYRKQIQDARFERLTIKPIRKTQFADTAVKLDQSYAYQVCAVSRRGVESAPTPHIEATPTVIEEPIFVADFAQAARGNLYGLEAPFMGTNHGKATCAQGILDLRQGGHLNFPHRGEFELNQPISVECWIHFDQAGQIPVVVGCGYWNQAGWFLQRIGNHWRWHVGGFDCDGGQSPLGRWVHVVATYDGQVAKLFEDGKLVAEKTGTATTEVWPGELHVGQYSQPHAQFQVHGLLAGLKIYHRVIDGAEAFRMAEIRPD